MFFLMNRQCSIPFQPSFISLSNSEKILYFWCPPKICVGNMDSCEHFQEKLRKQIFEEESLLMSSEKMCWARRQLWKLEENIRAGIFEEKYLWCPPRRCVGLADSFLPASLSFSSSYSLLVSTSYSGRWKLPIRMLYLAPFLRRQNLTPDFFHTK